MPVRIYALAKDWKIDSKDLVDICAKVGITGKGSALASLDDDEVVKLKNYLSGGQKKAASPAATEKPAPERPTQSTAAGPHQKVPFISSGPSIPLAAATAAKVAEAKAAEAKAAEVTAEPKGEVPAVVAKSSDTKGTSKGGPAPTSAAGDTTTAEEPAVGTRGGGAATTGTGKAAPLSTVASTGGAATPTAPAPGAASVSASAAPTQPAERDVFTRDEYIPPVTTNKIKVITGRPKPGGGDAKKDGDPEKKRPVKREPVINLARMPTAKQPNLAPKSNEPAPQKPDIRLPKDAIAVSRTGNRAPLEHITKSLTKPETTSPKRPGSGNRAPAAEAPIEAPSANKPSTKRGKDRTSEEEPGLLGIASARADRQKARKSRLAAKTPGEEEDSGPLRRGRTLTRKGTNTAAPRKERAVLDLPCSIRTFSEAAGVPAAQVIKVLMGMGTMATMNAQLDESTAELVAAQLGVQITLQKPPTLEEAVVSELERPDDDATKLVERPPVITFLGHVDHGKTSLLDKIIGIDVAAGEAGGITQHIRAYQVEKGGRKISFVDTPGHEAFTEMRARGATVTDIAVLVVAADDGVMPQTEEAISHAKAANVPIVVALNKSDLRGTDINRIMQQLASQDLLPSEWGGDTEVVKTSALTGDGLDTLVETLFGIAELHELKANPDRPAVGTCLEAEQQGERGVVAKLIVQNGTMRVGDIIVCGGAQGRIKAMYDTLRPNTRVEEAGPSTPVNVTGLDIAPQAGEKFYVLNDISKARELAEQRQSRVREKGLSAVTPKVSFEKFQSLLTEGRLGRESEVAVLNLIIRADVRGSLEAIQKELSKFKHPEVQVKVLQYSVGGITTADVALASASDAVVVGFNVIPDEAARQMAEAHSVEIRRYEIIYKLTEDIKAMLEGKLKPEERIVEMGRAVVKQTFAISRVGVVAGCYVAQGNIARNCRIRVNRDGRTIGDYALDSLRREKDDVREVQRGMECGIRLVGFNDVKKDDILEAYRIEEVARSL